MMMLLKCSEYAHAPNILIFLPIFTKYEVGKTDVHLYIHKLVLEVFEPTLNSHSPDITLMRLDQGMVSVSVATFLTASMSRM